MLLTLSAAYIIVFVFLLLIPENQRENVNCHLSKEERKEISVDRERFIFIELYSLI